ncbi:FecR domain-containing protein [Thalassotalea fonticola]|uniref:FecR domain-containing protein n=1 Tax=Thalassotalea fonticola TaxID=3065649 RepID=A0ABZ0GKE6_9GAMM|nr:FecR domain-containing protein [Colwelliaceae bacterium S1-1]
MSNIHQLHQQAEQDDLVLDQASDWIAKMDRGLTTKESKQFQRWIHMSPEHMKVMFEVAQMWDKLDELNRLSDIFPKSAVKGNWFSNQFKAIAASVVFLVCVLLLQTEQLPFLHGQQQYTTLATQYETEVGESNTIHLPDSSVLVLNTNSLVNVTYSEEARTIELQRGELHIEVAHNKSRPLRVLAAGKVIQAVGTAFNVQVSDKLVELIVTDGKVLVDSQNSLTQESPISNRAIPVAKGEMIDLHISLPVAEGVVKKVEQSEISSKLSWRKGNLIFRGDSLADAIKEISRYSDISFELADDEQLRKIKVAGMFKTGDIDGLLSVLEKSFNIEYKKVSAKKITLALKG